MDNNPQFSAQDLSIPPKNFFERNWIWLVVTAIVAVVLLITVFVGGIMMLVFGSMKSSDAYKKAVAKARANPAVIEALGQPIEEGWMVSGNIHVNGPSGNAELSIPVSGPKNKGTIYLEAKKSGGQWSFSLLQVAIEGQEKRIDLLEEENPNKT